MADALVTLAERLTYAELNARANALAVVLVSEHGVKAEACVGICCEKSAAMLVGMLGVLKAGGAYVPLDPEFPEQRALTIVEDSGARVVVAQEGVCAWAGGSSVGGTVVVMVQ